MVSTRNLRLVSFDGGGVRSLSQLEIMKTIMHQLNWDPNEGTKLPCEQFDFMGGSGTGGLIAIMFARLRMSVDETFDEFSTIVEQVYQVEVSPSERTARLKACLEDLMKRRDHPLDMKLLDETTPETCPCFVLSSFLINAGAKLCLRSYPVKKSTVSPITIIDAALATCTMQPQFSPAISGQGFRRKEYIGPGVGASNPISEVIAEAHSLFGADTNVASLLSLGNGHPGIITLFPSDTELGLSKIIWDVMNDCMQKSRDIEQQIGTTGVYFRFSVEQGMQNEHIDLTSDPSWILTQTESYIEDPGTHNKFSAFVQRTTEALQTITLDQLKSGHVPSVSVQLPSDLDKKPVHVVVTNPDDAILKSLMPINIECDSHVAECMEGTRENILNEIYSWMENVDAPNILWLKGYPGVGKSAIASSVVEHLRSLKRLGSSFFFRREMANDMTPNALWRVVAHDLARRFRPIKEEMIARLKAEEIIPTTVNVDKLFRQLIRDPLTAIEETLTGALPVIVIDALDECGGLDAQHSEQRRNLLQTLKGWSRLPTKFKLFVTSRNESDIDQLFSTTNHHLIEVFAGKSVEAKSSQDITTFLKDRFQKIAMKYPRSLPLDWPGHQVVLELTTMAQGLFIWVKVITNFAGRGDPKEQLSLILRGNSASDMTKLYSLILDTSFPEQTENFIKCFRSILGAVILGKASLPTSSLLHLLSLTDTTMEHICNGLQAVMDSRDTLRIHHQSFVDFLMDQSRCPTSFLIDRKRESQTLTVACLRTMEDHLRFNICNFETSYLRNAGIQNLAARVEECIPHHLSYSSCFWASHLAEIPFEREVMGYLEIFMAKQFLYWLEVLSGMKRVNIASGMLWILINYLQDGGQSDAMAKDMQKFVSTFGSVISRSLPHIYLSALTFAPKNSAVSQKYIKDYPRMLAIQSGGQSEWPAIQNILVDHDDQVRSVSFSPDSRRIVSGSDDRTIRVWDAETGDIVAGPFEGHVEAVNSVAFSPNGSRIVSGSEDGTIRLWDAETGELVTGSFEGHNKAINSVAFSPDGTWVVSGSSDTTIRVWEAKTGQAVTGPLKGHSKIVKSVAFSPNSRRIVSGSYDRTIRVWDAETGQVVTGPLKGHRKTVNSVAFSLDGRRIVSGSLDRTIRVWDAETGKLVVGPFKAHRSAVKSVAFSPDGRRIVSGSYDQSVRLWDAETGRMITQPLKGHDEAVLSVAFSPDGRRIVSGSEDSTIRLWDAETSDVDMVPLKGHHKTVNSVAFSPDGGRIVSCSMDSTIRVWDSETGEVVAGPMEEDSSVNSVSFSPHGNRIVTGTNDGIIRVWDAKTGEVATESLEEDGSAVYSVAFSPDGKRVVSGSDCGIIRVWDAETGELVVGPMEEDSPVNSVSFSPNGRSIVSGSEDSTTRLWDAETGKVILGPLKGHGGAVNSVDISPDGRWIASGSGDHTIRLWDSETGQMVVSPLKGHQGSVQSVAFSPNGRQIASSSFDYTIRLWDAETGQVILGPLKGHHSGIMSVAFSADSRRIVSGSYDCTIRVWDIETGQVLARLLEEHKVIPDAPAGESNNLICTTPIFGDSSRMDEIDGWVCGADYELLFWIPPDLRLGLYRPSNTLVIGPIVKTVLDFTNFVHGESWVHCRDKISL